MAADAVTPPLPPGFEVDPPLPEGFVADGATPAAPAAGGLQRTGAAAIPTAAEAAGGAYVPPQPTEAAIAAGQRQQRAAQNPVREKVVGAVEAGLDILSKVVGGGVGGLVGVTGLLGGGVGEKGMEAGAQKGVGLVRDVYRQTGITDGGGPQTEFGQQLTEGFDQGMANLPPIAGVRGTLAAPAAMPMELGARANLGLAVEPIRKPLEAPIAAMKEVVQRVVPEKKPTPGTKASGGAAATDIATQRRERAADLPVPIDLTEGQATRDFEQQRFERETAKDSESGKPLRKRYADQNEKVQQNLDALRDLTGAEITDTADAGARVVKALGDKAAKAKEEIRAAYDEARAAGEMEMPVAVAEVRKYIDDQTPTTKEKLAPIIKMVDEQIAKNDPEGTGQVSIAALEDIRQAIRANTEYGTPNSVHGAELIKRIDAATEGQGGDLYKAARKKYGEYAAEFKNRAIVADLMGTKKGSADRKVATENVFKRAILGSSGAEELTSLRNTLRSAGDDGKQAWRELQGQTLKHIKDEATKNVARDDRGNAIVSAAGMDRAITALDKNGKLDLIFGKNGAQKLRDINDLTKDVYTAPPGAVNTSNTASVIMGAIDTILTFSASGVPVPALTVLKALRNKVKNRVTDKKVRAALGEEGKAKPVDTAARPFEEPEPPPAAKAPTPKTPPKTEARAESANPKLAEIERLKKDASPEVAKVLEEQAKKVQDTLRVENEVKALEKAAQAATDPEIRKALIARANEMRPEKVPVGEATEIPMDAAPKPKAEPVEPVPVGEARELPATPDTRRAVDDLIVNAADEAAWRKLHRFGDLDAKSAQTVAQAIRYDAAAVDRAMTQHERSPRAFEREIARIIEEGKARESEAQQVGRSGEGLERPPGEEPGAAPAKPSQARPDGADAPRTQREEPDAARRQDGEVKAPPGAPTVAQLFADNKGIKRADMPVVPARAQPEFIAELKADGIKATEETVRGDTLKPTQSEFNAENIEYLRREILGGRDNGSRIVVSSDNRVIDGHHRWAVKAQHKLPVDILRVDLPVDQLLARAKDFQRRQGLPARSVSDGIQAALRRSTDGTVSKERESRIQEAKSLAGDLPKEIVDEAVKVLRQYEGPPPVEVPSKVRTRLEEFIAPLIEKAKAVNEGFSQQVRDIAGQLGAEAKTAPVKGAKRAVEKLYLDELDTGLEAWPESIGDLVRASIVVKNEADIVAAIKAVRENLDVIRVKDRFTTPLPTGYRDVLINVRLPNGMKAELQIHVPDMLKAKELGHLLYEVERVTPEGAERAGLVAAQQRLYGAAYELSTGRRDAGGQASTSRSNSARPISTTPSQEGSARPVGAAISPPDSDQKAGSPSRSKNLAPDGNLTASTGAILADAPIGKQAVVTTERGMRVPVQYRVAEVGQLVTSHDDALKANPQFPAELQPRDRTRQSSADQINRIANDIRPEWMAESPKASDGAPIIGADAVVESGNARTMALRRAYATGKAEAYKAWLIENAERFGLTPAQVNAMKEPVLVRQGMGEYDRAEFTKQANESTVAEVSATERAKTDAKRLPDLEDLRVDEDGRVNMAASADWVRAFMRDTVEPNKRGEIMTSSGQLSQTGERRIQNAIFMAAYDDASLMERMAEATDPAGKNIISGMLRAAPDVAKLRNLVEGGAREQPTWIEPLVEAVRRFGDAREAGQTVSQYLAQGSLLGGEASPAVSTMMQNLEAFSRAPRRLADHIKALARESSKDPRQTELLEKRATYGKPAKLADDLGAQQEFLAQRASAAGFKSLDEFVDGDFEGFMRAADEWRQRNPATELREPDLLSAQTPADLKAKTEREARAIAADKAEQQRLADKAKADAMVDDFALTGSDRPADAANQGSLFERSPGAYNAPYETDLFGNPVPAPQGAGSRRPSRGSAADDGDIQPGADVPVQAPAGRYATRASLVTTRQQKLGHVGTIKSLEDAANAVAYLNKSAVERLDAVVTDARGRPLGVIGGFKGALTQASVYPSTLLGEALQIPRAAKVWLVHNHPSGNPRLSDADRSLARNIAETFDGTAIEPAGIIAVGGKQWGGANKIRGFKDSQEGELKPSDGGPSVPAQERQIVEDGKLGPAIVSPNDAKRIVSEMVKYNAGRPTIVLLDAQHVPVAAIPWAVEDAMPLRNNGKLDSLLRAVAQSNAGAALIGTGDSKAGGKVLSLEQAQNIGAALAKSDVNVLDIIDSKGGSEMERGGRTAARHVVAAAGATTAGAAALAGREDDEL